MNSDSTDGSATADREIVATRLFDAPRDLVFDMWTDPVHVAKWWGPIGFTNTIHEMDVRPGGIWRFVMHGPDGVDYQNKSIFTEVVRPERLAYSHVSGPTFQVTVTFEEQGARTRLTMRMVFDSAAKREKVVKEFGAVEGMKQTLVRLGEHLSTTQGTGTVQPQSSAFEFSITRVFQAPRALVFKAWTESERLRQWWGPKGFSFVVSTIDLRPGGLFHYCMRSPDGRDMWGKFVFREIAAPERLAFVVSFSDPDGATMRNPFNPDWPAEVLNTLVFTENDGKTTVAMRGSPINATELEIKTFGSHHGSLRQGFAGTLAQLDDYLAQVTGIPPDTGNRI